MSRTSGYYSAMTTNITRPDPDHSNTEKDPDTWVTGDEPMTGAQQSYLATLAEETGQTVPADLTKAEASSLIDELQTASDRAG
ncbi:MAG: DUF3072 domain-containing protein [Euzebya tangerina]|nr:DUF3072 domain-containing protein [Euzebya tangerina]